MTYKLLIQYPNRNPQDYEDIGFVDLDNAIKLFNEFNWTKQYILIEKRGGQNLTSPSPVIIFQNDNYTETLTIVGTSEGDYEVIYEKDNKISTDHISENFTKNPSGNSIQDIIIALYQQELEAQYKLQSETSDENIIELGKYNPLRYKYPFLVFIIPIILLIVFIIFSKYDKSLIEVLIYLVAFFSIINSPFILIISQYLSKPKIESVILRQEVNSLQIKYSDHSTIINRDDILQCAFTYCNNGRIPWQEYSNISIILKNKSQHFLTTITFSREDLEKIIEAININIYQFETSFQFLKIKDY